MAGEKQQVPAPAGPFVPKSERRRPTEETTEKPKKKGGKE